MDGLGFKKGLRPLQKYFGTANFPYRRHSRVGGNPCLNPANN